MKSKSEQTRTPLTGAKSDLNIPKPVELMRDQRGIYGIGAVSPSIPPVSRYEPWRPDLLILRPDRFDESEPQRAVLQKITGGFRRSIFFETPEERLRQIIHHEALKRAGLPWPPNQHYDYRWWSTDKRERVRNRAVYHGLRRLSLHVINSLIDQAVAAAADTDALMLARRFAFKHRENIYRAAARSRRALQLAATFPLLALVIYSDHRIRAGCSTAPERECEAPRISAAATLVERGARLRHVASVMDVPMALRHIKPGVADLAGKFICRHPNLLAFMPTTTAGARIWLYMVRWVDSRFGELHVNATGRENFTRWVARHAARMPGRRLNEVGFFLSDIADWVRAGLPANTDWITGDCSAEHLGRRFVVRPFTPSMSLRTVTKLSADWHEAVASNMDGPDLAFPPPWFPAATIDDYQIVPIETAAELYREGRCMHHCVGTFGGDVRSGEHYIYSIRRDGARVATMALVRNRHSASLGEIRGPCNASPAGEVIATARRWLRKQAPLPPLPDLTRIAADSAREGQVGDGAAKGLLPQLEDDDADIPF